MGKPNKILEEELKTFKAEREEENRERRNDFWKSQNTIVDGAKHLATLVSLMQGLLIAAIAFGNIQELLKGLGYVFFILSLLLLTFSLISSALVFFPHKDERNLNNEREAEIRYTANLISRYRTKWLSRGYILFITASITVMATLMFIVSQPASPSTGPSEIIIMTPTSIPTSTSTPAPILPTEIVTSTSIPKPTP